MASARPNPSLEKNLNESDAEDDTVDQREINDQSALTVKTLTSFNQLKSTADIMIVATSSDTQWEWLLNSSTIFGKLKDALAKMERAVTPWMQGFILSGGDAAALERLTKSKRQLMRDMQAMTESMLAPIAALDDNIKRVKDMHEIANR
jgi:hypothetical protein